MIKIIIILLAVVLVALLVDWRKILLKLPKRPTNSRPVRMPRLSARAVAKRVNATPSQPTADAFPMDAPSLETVDELATGNPELDKLLAEADIHFRKGEMKAAEQLYLQVASKDPRCAKAYSRLGVIYLENGEDWEDAEAAFRQAIKTDPHNGYVLNNLGLVLYHQDKFADAIRHFEQAVHLDDLNASRHANLGMAYMAMRQYAKAESSFKKALKLAPNEMEYKDLLAEAVEKKLAHKTMVRR
jgi:Flp pilus assembly protein TadD